MRTRNARPLILAVAALLIIAAGHDVSEAADSWKSLNREAKRMKIDEMAEESLAELKDSSDKAQALFEQAYGWAVFDNLKIAFGFSGGGGNGVAVDKGEAERTYMKMGTIGIGFGLGGRKYQVVFLFQDERTFTNFVERGWQADASASAVAGTEGAEVGTGFVNGLAIFQLTDKGLMANADVAGTKYWKNKKLNRK
jgi:lipid-binding SYLF domain-containing protein